MISSTSVNPYIWPGLTFNRFISTFLFVWLVLMSGTSFKVGIHRCGGRVQHVALFTEAETCPMERQSPACHLALKATCCEDLKMVHNQSDFNAQPVNHDITHRPFGYIIPPAATGTELISLSVPAFYPKYDPPVLLHDRLVAHRVFLI